MSQTNGNTPGGTPTQTLVNPLFTETGPTDSGEGQLLHNQETLNPFQRRPNIRRSPSKEKRSSSLVHRTDAFSNDTAGHHNLEKENQELKQKLREMEAILSKLNTELITLKQEKVNIKLNIETNETSEDEDLANRRKTNRFEYLTDEEDLERETNWIIKRNKSNRKSKKRKAESSPEQDEQVQQTAQQPEVQPKEKAPPPVNIIGVTNFSEIQELMNSVTDRDYKITALNNNVWKINTSTSNAYRNLTMKLNCGKHQWHTYENKNDRHIKVMARGLHPTCATEDIIDDLRKKGLKILGAVNIIKKEKGNGENRREPVTKKGLPLFMLTFDKSENIQNIFNLTGILNMRVKIEAIKRASTKIAQCKKCQGFNHTQKYCGREIRCVKCAGKHPTEMCTLTRDAPPKCVNCSGQHPASYRGCEVAKHLQKIRNQARKTPENQMIQANKDSSINKTAQHIRKEGTTFAQVVKSSNLRNDNDITENMRINIQAILKSLEEQNKLNKLIFDQFKLLGQPLQPITKAAGNR